MHWELISQAQLKPVSYTHLDNLKKIPIIYTYRTSNEGGEKSIDVDDYCRLCKYVSEISEKYNVAMIDVELYENKDQKNIGKLLLDIKSTGVKVIGSNPVSYTHL